MYKIAVLNGRLASSELSVMYGQLGGDACFPLQFDAPDLLCRQCHMPLVLLLQHVSPASTETIHRVTYLFICNSSHCADTGLVLTVNTSYSWSEKAEKACNSLQTPLEPQQSLLIDTGDATIDLLSTLKGVSLSGPSAPEPVPATAPSSKEQDSIPSKKIHSPLPAFDLRSHPVEQKQIQHALGEVKQTKADDSEDDDNGADDGNIDGTPMEILQWRYPKAMALYGYDMPPLLPPKDKQVVVSSIDSKKYVHEYDVFPTVISALQLYKHGQSEDSSAEFRMISVWGARTMEPGVHFGYLYVVPEEEMEDCFNQN